MIIRCPRCQNTIFPSEYRGVYRCRYCHIWLREDEVIKVEILPPVKSPIPDTKVAEVKKTLADTET
jgi:hypothetical protein